MTHRFLLIVLFFSVLVGCGGGSDTKKADTQNGDEQKIVAMSGYKFPDSIVILDVKE